MTVTDTHKGAQVRHYILPVFTFQHRKGGPAQLFLLLNGKAGMPPKLRDYEGRVALFGGGEEPGEDYLSCIHRELREELPALRSVAPEAQADWTNAPAICDDVYAYTIMPVYCGEWSQATYRKLAGSCREGYVLPVDIETLDKLTFCTARMREHVLAATVRIVRQVPALKGWA